MSSPKLYQAWVGNEEVDDDCNSIQSSPDGKWWDISRAPPNSRAASPTPSADPNDAPTSASAGVRANSNKRSVEAPKRSEQVNPPLTPGRTAQTVANIRKRVRYSDYYTETVETREVVIDGRRRQISVMGLSIPKNLPNKTTAESTAFAPQRVNKKIPEVVEDTVTPTPSELNLSKGQMAVTESSPAAHKPGYASGFGTTEKERSAEGIVAVDEASLEDEGDWEVLDHSEVMNESVILDRCR
ncbi:hypothetical protein OPT61_g6775 [Boeremia exigua]|uniref:Uncharacterized protein n=1 Tax=Boeremia exigua TaxID=749465 RepID=A0ACC2I4W2_9PLEO|nr:hypothetical protein OPT61_g6775 [Boeremia exigua]